MGPTNVVGQVRFAPGVKGSTSGVGEMNADDDLCLVLT